MALAARQCATSLAGRPGWRSRRPARLFNAASGSRAAQVDCSTRDCAPAERVAMPNSPFSARLAVLQPRTEWARRCIRVQVRAEPQVSAAAPCCRRRGGRGPGRRACDLQAALRASQPGCKEGSAHTRALTLCALPCAVLLPQAADGANDQQLGTPPWERPAGERAFQLGVVVLAGANAFPGTGSKGSCACYEHACWCTPVRFGCASSMPAEAEPWPVPTACLPL